MTASAITIYQDFLDHMGEALIARDEEAFLRHIFLPHAIRTETKTFEFDTFEEAQVNFNGFVDALAAQGVDDYTRVAREARFEGETHIAGRHDSFITSGGKLVVPQFSNEMELELRDGIWGSNWSRHRARYVAWPNILPRPSEGSDAD